MLCRVSNQPADGAISLAQGTKKAFIGLNNILGLEIQFSLKMTFFFFLKLILRSISCKSPVSWEVDPNSLPMNSNIPGELLWGEYGHLQDQVWLLTFPFGHVTRIYHQWAGKTKLVLAPDFKSTNGEQVQLPDTGSGVIRERATGTSLLFLSKVSEAWKSPPTTGASMKLLHSHLLDCHRLESWTIAYMSPKFCD